MTGIPTNLYPQVCPDLNVADVDVVTDAAGPGRRLVVWLQGCLKRCRGCANGPFLSQSTARIISVEELLRSLDAVADLAGITLSGGEPVLQASALLPLVGQVRSRRLSVVCYSGYQIEELLAKDASPVLRDFLKDVDLLIDGEYRSDTPRVGPYRPSANQRVHYLSERISPDQCTLPSETEIRLVGGQIVTTGTLPTWVCNQLFDRLRSRGILLGPSG